MVEPFCTFKYRSDGINNALEEAFGRDSYLFGHGRTSSFTRSGDSVKVGVVSCLEGRSQPCLIANHNRKTRQGAREHDYLQREDKQEKDFKIWQAARATSAAQTIFKSHYHEATSRTADPPRPAPTARDNIKKMLPASIRKTIDTGLDMVASTLDCCHEWDGFLKFNSYLSDKCHRLEMSG
ncbi:hypothetical protein B0T24DRAFT_685617 [Lasiosphaeria ovina]|uniref:Uncharacterized protein n=1 Tax=Lasiosphaeria ovina TaxID=92902 RepID=A0AAE0JS16_9PEZI|nr:hypothetical protein B0T24DRAFT_685617 [Lasiosphaeria ovina]